MKNELLEPPSRSNFQASDCSKKWNYNTIFKTQEQNLPLVVTNLSCDNLKTIWGTGKHFSNSLSFFNNFSSKNKYHYTKKTWLQKTNIIILKKHDYKKS